MSEFENRLTEFEKKVYQKSRAEVSEDEVERDKRKLISPLNDLIQFNPFQYEPYYKLKEQPEYPKAVYIADEVGAGKTIETGIVLTELLFQKELDLRKDICLIVCPNLLCRKWHDTLKKLFGLGTSIVHSIEAVHIGINIISFDTISRTKERLQVANKLKVLIIDEVHNASGQRYEKIQSLRNNVDEQHGYVVLLSATPLSGNAPDENKQKEILKPEINIENFFVTESVFLCKNKKSVMRYAFAPDGNTVTVNPIAHYIENEPLKKYLDSCKDLLAGKNTLLKLQGLNAIMSSPESGLLFLKKLLEKSDEELLDYLMSSHEREEDDYDDESEDDYEEEDEGASCEFTIEKVKEIRNSMNEVLTMLNNMREQVDPKLSELINIIKENENNVINNRNGEGEFYRHIIVFTDRVSSAHYLEDKFRNVKVEPDIEVFCVTGELLESEKLDRLSRYENEKDKMSVLIITNVACEGQDLDFGNTIVNYDLDYNPVRLEQRRGRVDRFQVNKKEIFIHNFMVAGFDYDPKKNETEPSYGKYSKVKKIRDKIDNIEKTTGTYYEILDTKNENNIDEENLEIVKKGVFIHALELAGLKDDVNDLGAMDCSKLQELIIPICLNQFGENPSEDSLYDMVSRRLEKAGIEIKEQNDDKIRILVKKSNQDFLQYVLCGGTMISHIIMGGDF